MAPPAIARVIVDLSLDRPFDYRVPAPLRPRIELGSRVRVPFGNSRRFGYVVGFPAHSAFPDLKEIEDIDGDRALLSPSLLKLGKWMADYYCCSREQATLAMLPAVVRSGSVRAKVRKVASLAEGIDPADALAGLDGRAKRQAEVIKTLARCHQCSLRFLRQQVGAGASVVNGLVAKGLIRIDEEREERDPFAGTEILPTQPLKLTPEQQQAMTPILASLAADNADVVLLHGVTGSGKTEVYLQAIAKCLEDDRSAIVLVPEIALTPQTTERFRSRFGDTVCVLHSRLSDGERFDEWTKINEGRVQIVVGARSALFAPFRNLGLIVVDEEHETSYKQDRVPRYHARDVAVMRGHFENATVVLGTATPALESYHNVKRGKYVLAELPKRIDDQSMPAMEVADMAAEAASSDRPQILSRQLIGAIGAALDNGEQVMLFLNRRGYATRLQCLKCGYVADCDDCSLAYTYHRTTDHLICHMCGAIRHAPSRCPDCGNPEVRYSGLGTQKIEIVVRSIFSSAEVVRMDADTMTRKDSYRETLTAFRAGAIDILIGTQMIAKGLHFPNVTLVGVVFADLGLNLPDFRAGERTFQLVVQVAGRAGRGEIPGRVIVQTYTPYHPVIQAALRQDYKRFFDAEIQTRKEVGFPPARRLLLLHLQGEEEAEVAATAEQLAEAVRPQLPSGSELIPAMPSPIPKKRGEYHYQVLCFTPRIVTLSRRIKQLLSRARPPKGVRINVDVDPYSIL